MDATPEMPAGAEITRTVDAHGVTLSWDAYKPGARSMQIPAAVFLLIWLSGWTIGGIVSVLSLVNGRGHPLLVLWLCGWAAGEVFVAWHLYNMFRAPTPESVRLEADALSYDPGCGPDEARSCAERPDGKIVPVTPAPAAAVARTAVRKFGIDCVNERERLYVDTDGRRFEIGGCLTGPERAWVLAVLQQWLGRSAAAPPWAREARHKEGTQP